MDGWLRLLFQEDLVPKLAVLRSRIEDIFLRRIISPSAKPPPMDEATVGVIARVVWEEMQGLCASKNMVRAVYLCFNSSESGYIAEGQCGLWK